MEIFGRDKIIEVIKRRLEDKSIIFVAERRVGKTTVLDKLKEEHSDECIVIYRDLEKIKSVYELENEVYDSVKEYVDFFSQVHFKKRFTQLEIFVSNIKKEGLKYKRDKNWKRPFTDAIKSLCSNSGEKRVIFLWDELPYMLQNIHEQDIKDQTQHAFDLLDILRTLDSEVDNLRFVFTGSIGLHHVEKIIKKGKNSEPFNNMDTIELKPLSPKDAKEMAIHYLDKESINYQAEDDLVEFIYTSCDFVPFYIEKIIKRLGLLESVVTLGMVEDEMELMLADDKNTLEMEHFVDRLEIYYDGMVKDVEGLEIKRSAIAKSLLGYLADSDEVHCAEECFRFLKTQYKIDDISTVKELLSLLAKDYYIQADKDKKYQFTFTIIKRWWVKNG